MVPVPRNSGLLSADRGKSAGRSPLVERASRETPENVSAPHQAASTATLVESSLNALHEGVQILSPDWRYVYVNEAAARQGRVSRDALLGKTMPECYPGIAETPMFATLQRCMRDRVAETLENEFAYEDGRRAWFELRIRPCEAGLILISVDMTERKSHELELQAAYRQALRDLINPVVRVHHGVLLLPLVGALDGDRASKIMESLLERVVQESAKVVIIDIAGLPVIDSDIAHHLLQATSMIRLLGAKTIVTGLKAPAAKAIVRLGVDLSSMETTSQLSEGIEMALASVGRAVISRQA